MGRARYGAIRSQGLRQRGLSACAFPPPHLPHSSEQLDASQTAALSSAWRPCWQETNATWTAGVRATVPLVAPLTLPLTLQHVRMRNLMLSRTLMPPVLLLKACTHLPRRSPGGREGDRGEGRGEQRHGRSHPGSMTRVRGGGRCGRQARLAVRSRGGERAASWQGSSDAKERRGMGDESHVGGEGVGNERMGW